MKKERAYELGEQCVELLHKKWPNLPTEIIVHQNLGWFVKVRINKYLNIGVSEYSEITYCAYLSEDGIGDAGFWHNTKEFYYNDPVAAIKSKMTTAEHFTTEINNVYHETKNILRDSV